MVARAPHRVELLLAEFDVLIADPAEVSPMLFAVQISDGVSAQQREAIIFPEVVPELCQPQCRCRLAVAQQKIDHLTEGANGHVLPPDATLFQHGSQAAFKTL